MRELIDIIRAFGECTKKGKQVALATVVRVSGSTYRRPGARMLFSEKGRLAGLINAACLESDLSERAKQVIHRGKSELISYDTTSPDDIVFGLGLGCNGTVDILMEPSRSPLLAKKIAILERCMSGENATVLATVVVTGGFKGVQLGDYVARDARGTVTGSITDHRLASTVESDIKAMSASATTQKMYPREGGEVEVFFEVINSPLPLVIFGGGPDVIPLLDAAKLLGWNVTVVDHRPSFATKENVPGADHVVLSEPEQLSDRVSLSDRHIAVIMTHNFDKDRKLLRLLLNSPARYVGLLGPKGKLDTLLQNLEQEGFKPNEKQLRRLHAPIGLDIGAETPEEIAFSIISEIKAVIEGRSGGFLKDRRGAIH